MSCNDPQGSPNPKARFCPSTITPIQIERLKKEEEDEHWISGEELYTEGSSDDDDDHRLTKEGETRNAGNIRSNYRDGQTGRPKLGNPSQQRPQIKSQPEIVLKAKKKVEEPDSCGDSAVSASTVSSSPQNAETLSNTVAAESADEEKEISWRPKRDDDCTSNLIFEDPIVELRELQLQYRGLLDSVSRLKSLTQLSGEEHINNETEIDDVVLETVLNVNEKSAITSELEAVKDISFSEDVERWSDAIRNTAKLKKEIVNMIKLDRWIEKLDEKVKKTTEERLNEQFLNRNELKRLQAMKAPESGHLAKNSSQFFKLYSIADMESQEGQEISNVPIDSTFNSSEPGNLKNKKIPTPGDDEESRRHQRKELEKKLTLIEKRKADLIERNKELASCAMGTLAITDEEKSRLEELLGDSDEEDGQTNLGSTTSNLSTVSSTPYTIDKEADELLKNLTEQLENINSETYRKSEEEQYTREEFLAHKKQRVLNSLRLLAESESKDIHPISEEEIRQLINEYYAEQDAKSSRVSFDQFQSEFTIDSNPGEKKCSVTNGRTPRDKPGSASTISNVPGITQKVIQELVKEARTAMPLFKFKHLITESELIVELNNDDEKNLEGNISLKSDE